MKNRVLRAKAIIAEMGFKNPKGLFFDEVYGKLYTRENNRLHNLWNCAIEDEDFTLKLENFVNKLKNE